MKKEPNDEKGAVEPKPKPKPKPVQDKETQTHPEKRPVRGSSGIFEVTKAGLPLFGSCLFEIQGLPEGPVCDLSRFGKKLVILRWARQDLLS